MRWDFDITLAVLAAAGALTLAMTASSAYSQTASSAYSQTAAGYSASAALGGQAIDGGASATAEDATDWVTAHSPCISAPGCNAFQRTPAQTAAFVPAADAATTAAAALTAEADVEAGASLPQDPTAPVPLPAALALMGVGMAAFGLMHRRRAGAPQA
ncbi:MAG: VPLPA-CTERM sorting domain-containing protein [Pseudomonadota bacterium]